jgi:hypothetical protein
VFEVFVENLRCEEERDSAVEAEFMFPGLRIEDRDDIYMNDG